LKKTRRLNEMLIRYFKALYFLTSLPFNYDIDIMDHFKKIEKLVKKYEIQQTEIAISYRFIREILKEIKEIGKLIVQKMRKLLTIDQDIDEKEIFHFITSDYFKIVLTLSNHYWIIYPEGIPVLGKLTYYLIKGKDVFLNARYDISDDKTFRQLSPLLEGKNPEEYPQIIEKWRNPYYTFKILSQEERERIETAEIDWEKLWEDIKAQIYDNNQYEKLFMPNGPLGHLDEEVKGNIKEIFDIIFNPEQKKTIDFNNLKESLEGYLDENKIKILVGYFTLLKDIYLKQFDLQKTIEASTIRKLDKKIQSYWQEFGDSKLGIWPSIIYQELVSKLESIKRIGARKTTILLSYLTDHPKTLLEIGKYPVSTCQDYESTGSWNKALLGYVLDAHIKALVLREIEIETEEEIREENLNQAKVELDEEKETIKITLPSGKTIEGKISKPKARSIVMLGKTTKNKPVLLKEPLYPKELSVNESLIKILDEPLKKVQEELGLEIVYSSNGIVLPPSHNPAGYYQEV